MGGRRTREARSGLPRGRSEGRWLGLGGLANAGLGAAAATAGECRCKSGRRRLARSQPRPWTISAPSLAASPSSITHLAPPPSTLGPPNPRPCKRTHSRPSCRLPRRWPFRRRALPPPAATPSGPTRSRPPLQPPRRRPIGRWAPVVASRPRRRPSSRRPRP